MGSGIECRLVPFTERFDASSDRWAEQVNDFAAELLATGDPVQLRTEPVMGKKGALTTILVEIVSGSLTTLTAQTISDWLRRDRSRGARLELDMGAGASATVELRGDTAPEERERLIRSLLAPSSPDE